MQKLEIGYCKYIHSLDFYRMQINLREGNVFTHVCLFTVGVCCRKEGALPSGSASGGICLWKKVVCLQREVYRIKGVCTWGSALKGGWLNSPLTHTHTHMGYYGMRSTKCKYWMSAIGILLKCILVTDNAACARK